MIGERLHRRCCLGARGRHITAETEGRLAGAPGDTILRWRARSRVLSGRELPRRDIKKHQAGR
jgi:hypothetical protein